jgi:hypothetical protein
MSTTRIEVELLAGEASALSQFVRRLSARAIREHVVDDTESAQIRSVLDKLQRALLKAKDARR